MTSYVCLLSLKPCFNTRSYMQSLFLMLNILLIMLVSSARGYSKRERYVFCLRADLHAYSPHGPVAPPPNGHHELPPTSPHHPLYLVKRRASPPNREGPAYRDGAEENCMCKMPGQLAEASPGNTCMGRILGVRMVRLPSPPLRGPEQDSGSPAPRTR